jgi:hypothetical protein
MQPFTIATQARKRKKPQISVLPLRLQLVGQTTQLDKTLSNIGSVQWSFLQLQMSLYLCKIRTY